ncbi:MAG: hypothetical protein B7X78_09230 [Sphingomonadales bacterium 39-62-4]|nr:MAG: hypothetical protein B7X78_09230 [Sphingomonadales bacterium 39-62-4]
MLRRHTKIAAYDTLKPALFYAEFFGNAGDAYGGICERSGFETGRNGIRFTHRAIGNQAAHFVFHGPDPIFGGIVGVA